MSAPLFPIDGALAGVAGRVVAACGGDADVDRRAGEAIDCLSVGGVDDSAGAGAAAAAESDVAAPPTAIGLGETVVGARALSPPGCRAVRPS